MTLELILYEKKKKKKTKASNFKTFTDIDLSKYLIFSYSTLKSLYLYTGPLA